MPGAEDQLVASSSSSDESSGDSATKAWNEKSEFTSESESTSESELIEQNTYSQLYYNGQHFLIFFQLCFQISDRAVLHLLAFMSALLYFLSSSYTKDSSLIIRKVQKNSNSYIKYVYVGHCDSVRRILSLYQSYLVLRKQADMT